MATNGFSSVAFSGTVAAGNAGANSIFLTQVTLIRPATVAAVLINITSAASGISFKAVIYDGSHSSLLATGSTVTSLAAGYNRLALTGAVSLAAGTYYVGYVCANSLTVSIQGLLSISWFVSGGQSVSSPANPLSGGAANSNDLMVALEFSGAAIGYGWGPDYTSGINLDATKTAATVTAATAMGARSIVARSTADGGKYYVEVKVGGTTNGNTSVGLYAANAPMISPTNLDKYAEWLNANGNAGGTVVVTPGGVSFTAGDTVRIAFDSSTGKIWFAVNGGSWAGNGASPNPSTGVSGIAMAPGSWPAMVYAGNGPSSVVSGGIFTLHDTAGSFCFSAPSGYSAWSAATGVLACSGNTPTGGFFHGPFGENRVRFPSPALLATLAPLAIGRVIRRGEVVTRRGLFGLE